MKTHPALSEWDITTREHSEFGTLYKFQCPDCRTEIKIVGDSQFSQDKCDCGRIWHAYLKVEYDEEGK